MNRIIKFAAKALAALTFVGAAVSCDVASFKEMVNLDTDQYSSSEVKFSAFAPNPVYRGGTITVKGSFLEKVASITVPGIPEITNFTVTKTGEYSELTFAIPAEGPEVGYITLITKEGKKLSSLAELTYTEPIELASFSPASALSGDVITITGDYLTLAREVIFGGGVIVGQKNFISQNRHEIKVKVPGPALTGKITLGDADQTVDPDAVPNKVASDAELSIGEPDVPDNGVFDAKNGDKITFKGGHLDMIESVTFAGGVTVTEFVHVSSESIVLEIPMAAKSGEITAKAYSGSENVIGTLEAVSPRRLSAVPDGGRYKANGTYTITGSNLDLISKVFTSGVESSFMMSGDESSLMVTVPGTSKDGEIVVSTFNGTEIKVADIQVVKPVILEVSETSVPKLASFTVKGTDLDLVVSATISKEACEIKVVDEQTLEVTVGYLCFTGPLVLTAENNETVEFPEIEVTYAERITLDYVSASVPIKSELSIVGTGFNQIESISVKGNKVTSFVERTDNAITFPLSADLGPGVYRLDIVFLDGEELTWPVPFELTASYTEKVLWEGESDLAGWSWNWEVKPNDMFVNAEAKPGDIVRIYGYNYADWWNIQFYSGHWVALYFPEYGGQAINASNASFDNGYISFTLDETLAAQFTGEVDWGSAFIMQGEGAILTKITIVQPADEPETLVYEGDGSVVLSGWTNHEIGGEDDFVNAGIHVGQRVRIYFEGKDFPAEWKIQIFDGHWGEMKFEETGWSNQFNNENTDITSGFLEFKVTQKIYEQLTTKAWWGSAIILQGEGGLVVKKITVIGA